MSKEREREQGGCGGQRKEKGKGAKQRTTALCFVGLVNTTPAFLFVLFASIFPGKLEAGEQSPPPPPPRLPPTSLLPSRKVEELRGGGKDRGKKTQSRRRREVSPVLLPLLLFSLPPASTRDASPGYGEREESRQGPGEGRGGEGTEYNPDAQTAGCAAYSYGFNLLSQFPLPPSLPLPRGRVMGPAGITRRYPEART